MSWHRGARISLIINAFQFRGSIVLRAGRVLLGHTNRHVKGTFGDWHAAFVGLSTLEGFISLKEQKGQFDGLSCSSSKPSLRS